MSQFFFELGLFSLKTLILVILIFSGILSILIMAARNKSTSSGIEVQDLSKQLDQESRQIRSEIGSQEELTRLKKETKREKKAGKKAGPKPRTFVLGFVGDMKASQVENLKRLINAIISIGDPQKDDVLICIESPGGMVHGYGLAAAQLMRLRERGIPLTASVDKVAASGGYLMAAVAHEIIAAPFAVLGSIGVVAQVPNLHRLLKKHDIDYEEITSGEYKRTVSVLGEITPDGRKHFEGKLSDTHVLFKNFVKNFRPNLDLAQVGNGDHWYGSECVALGLVDKIQTSDDWILNRCAERQIVQLNIAEKKNLPKKLAEAFQGTIENALLKALSPFLKI